MWGIGVARTNERINIIPKVLGISSLADRRSSFITSIAVVNSAQNECSDKSFGDFFSGGPTNLSQPSQLEEAAANNASNVLLFSSSVRHRGRLQGHAQA